MKTPKVNRDLVPFKILYFLLNGGSSFIPFLGPMAMQRGISSEGVGLIWTITPLFTSVCNVACGALADAFKLHKMILQTSCALLAVSFTSFFFLPSIPVMPVQNTISTNHSIFLQCMENESSFIMCPTDGRPQFAPGELYPLCNINRKNSEIAKIEKCDFKCKFTATNSEKIPYFPKGIPMKENFILKRQNACTEGQCFMVGNDNMTSLLMSSNQINCGKEFNVKCRDMCEDNGPVQTIPLIYLLKTPEFWMNTFIIIVIYVSFTTASSLITTMCFTVLGKNRHRFGQTRLFGAIGWGMMGGAMGLLINIVSKGQPATNYSPAMVITAFFLFFNLLFTTRINVLVPGKEPGDDVGKVLLSFSCIFLLTTSFIMGMTMGLVWTFEFIYIENVARLWDPEFSDEKLLLGLIIWSDCVLGEVTFFFLSTYIIKKLSNVHTFSLTLIAASVRVLLYSVITNPWVFLPVHLLHGLSFGVFFANMTSYAHLLAPKGAQATMQTIVVSTFTVGKCLGALGGGMLLEHIEGSYTFLTMGIIVTIYTIIYITVNCIVQRWNRNITQDDERGEYQNPNTKEKTEETESGDDQTCVHYNEEHSADNNSHKKEEAINLKTDNQKKNSLQQ